LALTSRLSTMDIEGALTFDPVPAGTRMRWSWQMRPRGLLKLLTPVVERVGRRQEQAIWAELKRLLEAREVARATDRADAACRAHLSEVR
jgi:hypothetical protein